MDWTPHTVSNFRLNIPVRMAMSSYTLTEECDECSGPVECGVVQRECYCAPCGHSIFGWHHLQGCSMRVPGLVP